MQIRCMPNLMFPVLSGRELAPDSELALIRLPWRHRARPSATLHEIHGLLG